MGNIRFSKQNGIYQGASQIGEICDVDGKWLLFLTQINRNFDYIRMHKRLRDAKAEALRALTGTPQAKED